MDRQALKLGFRAVDGERSVNAILQDLDAPDLAVRTGSFLEALVDHDLVWLRAA